MLRFGGQARPRAACARAVPGAPAMVRIEDATDPRCALHRLGDAARRREPAFLTMVTVTSPKVRPTPTCCRWHSWPANRRRERSPTRRPRCSRGSPAPAKGPSSTALLDDDVCYAAVEMSDAAVAAAVDGRSGARCTRSRARAAGRTKWVRTGFDQGNTVALLSDRYVLRLFRRIEPGPTPSSRSDRR